MREALRYVREEPFEARGRADVKQLQGDREPPMYRLRVGDWRAVYFVRGREVLVVRVFHRGHGYGWLDAWRL